mmetsp:Transcript_54170/g.121458  ORF Transcript_54170/g.121458 Transcript_54170/m.121458 type:complete len:198 (-) Transcript_54170:589-1182(-)
MRTSSTCGEPSAKFDFIPHAADHYACNSSCAARAPCVQWELSVQTRWCSLYNRSSVPRPNNADFDCVCRGPCPGPPPIGPAPPLLPSVWAWYTPTFLQSHGAYYDTEPALLGLTTLEQYTIDAASTINLGEAAAHIPPPWKASCSMKAWSASPCECRSGGTRMMIRSTSAPWTVALSTSECLRGMARSVSPTQSLLR